ncbi:MAG: tRNA lysidine(34) synthetase TilS, partial [Rhodospirillaceae bacterium]|nr:tRNA lysidine(34) synthetase TilS [Rhodospirillaceae bacterium]
ILTWQGEKPSAGIQAAARNARYRLMAKWVRDNNAACLMTAHHLEDQAETFLLRTERGSGLDGLACMAPIVQRESISLLRPLLAVSKHRLRATLIEAEQNWIEDPSNQNPAYRRTKMRGVVAALKKSKLSPKLLETVVGHFAELRQHLSRVVAVFFDRAVDIFPEGYGRVQLDIFEQLPDPVLERVLVRLTSIFGGKAYPPRRDRLLRAMEKIRDQKENGFTLGGCRFFKKSNAIMICRDRRHILAQQISAGEKINWNNLFDIEIDGQGGTGAILAPLGRAGWQEIVQYKPELKAISVPYAIRLTLPALFDETGVAQVPHLNYRRDDRKNPTVTISKVRFNPRQSA